MKDFFSLERLFWTIIYVSCAVGMVTLVILFRVNVLGIDAKFDPSPMRYSEGG